MNSLYVSDLDGTLLRSDETLSEYTISVINDLVEQGMLFSYATARSLITAKKVTRGLQARIPLIVYNGAFVFDNITEEILISNFFDDSVYTILEELFTSDIYPIVYSYLNGKEIFSFVPELCSEGTNAFLSTRKGDVRWHPVASPALLKEGELFYVTCIDKPEKLEPFYQRYKDKYHCVYHTDIYTSEQWLEIMPPTASKANAIQQLQAKLQTQKLIVFGDAQNDIDMFRIADECYAMANAQESLKKYATAIILSNNEDGVAKWLSANWMKDE